MEPRTVEEPTEGSTILAQAWVSESGLVTYLQDFLERPEGAQGPESLEVELGVTGPLQVAADELGVDEAAVLDAVTDRFRGDGGALLRWARGLDRSESWSRTEPM